MPTGKVRASTPGSRENMPTSRLARGHWMHPWLVLARGRRLRARWQGERRQAQQRGGESAENHAAEHGRTPPPVRIKPALRRSRMTAVLSGRLGQPPQDIVKNTAVSEV